MLQNCGKTKSTGTRNRSRCARDRKTSSRVPLTSRKKPAAITRTLTSGKNTIMTCTFSMVTLASLGLAAKVSIYYLGTSLLTRNLLAAIRSFYTRAQCNIPNTCVHPRVLQPQLVTGRTFRPNFTITTTNTKATWPITLQVLTVKLFLHRSSFSPTRTIMR